MHPYLAKESYTYLVSSLYIMAFATRSGGRILHAQTYPLQEVDAEEGDGRLIRTVRYHQYHCWSYQKLSQKNKDRAKTNIKLLYTHLLQDA